MDQLSAVEGEEQEENGSESKSALEKEENATENRVVIWGFRVFQMPANKNFSHLGNVLCVFVRC